MPPLSEFSLIDRYFAPIAQSPAVSSPYIDLSIGDDCALLSIPDGQQLALSIDTLNANVHFPAEAKANLIAERALAVSISDLAAMGATPLALTLAISMPELDELWLADFSRGLKKSADYYGIQLIGGDTTQGPLSITLQVQGLVAKGCAIKRSGAQVGDSVYVTGSLGDAAAALKIIEGDLSCSETQRAFLAWRYYQPMARVGMGQGLQGLATAAIDISDGLAADLGHIVTSSAVAAELYTHQLPLSPTLQQVCSPAEGLDLALAGGDDYELCFTAAVSNRDKLLELSQLIDVPITEVGRIVEGDSLICLDAKGQRVDLLKSGYQHFGS